MAQEMRIPQTRLEPFIGFFNLQVRINPRSSIILGIIGMATKRCKLFRMDTGSRGFKRHHCGSPFLPVPVYNQPLHPHQAPLRSSNEKQHQLPLNTRAIIGTCPQGV